MRLLYRSNFRFHQMANLTFPAMAVLVSATWFPWSPVAAQEVKEDPQSPVVIEIAKSPDHIPPKDVVPEVLSHPLTVEIQNTPLSNVVETLREQLKLTVLLDEVALQKRDVLPSDPISLNGPFDTAYALLQQLNQAKIGWYLDGDVLHLTDLEDAENHLMTVAHNIGDLLDLKFAADDLEELVKNSVGGDWESADDGSLIRLGDVLFVRQNMAVQLRVQALLKALKQPSERSLLMQSAQNQKLRELLTKKISVAFSAVPLDQAISDIGQQLDAAISLDIESLEAKRLRPNHAISLVVQDRSASQTLQFLLAPLKLAAIVKNDQIFVTTQEKADELKVSAVFDVRDLCRNSDETYGLLDAFKEQAKLDSIYFAKAGLIVIRETEPNLNVALNMLNNYRVALKSSKPRTEDLPNDKDVITVYYRMPTEMAASVSNNLPILIGDKLWNDADDSIDKSNEIKSGTILLLTSNPELLTDEISETSSSTIVPYSALVITHRREVHHKIVDCLRNIYFGDNDDWLSQQGLGGGMGGGGFGGGMFAVPSKK